MTISERYPLGRHEVISDQIDMIYFSDVSPRHAVISFSSMNPGKFERYEWFKTKRLEVPTLYIFLKDEAQHYYLGEKNYSCKFEVSKRLESLLLQYGIEKKNATTVGSSMGGYASIYYGFLLNLGRCISINPQIDRDSAKLHKSMLWKRKIDESSWMDLDDFLCDCDSNTKLLLVHGIYPADASAAVRVLAALSHISDQVTIQLEQSDEHGWMGMTADRLRRVLVSGTFDNIA